MVDSTSDIFTYNSEIGVICCFAQAKFLLLVWSHTFQHTVKNMVVPLILGLVKRGKKNIQQLNWNRWNIKNCGLMWEDLPSECVSLFQFAEISTAPQPQLRHSSS